MKGMNQKKAEKNHRIKGYASFLFPLGGTQAETGWEPLFKYKPSKWS